MTERRHLHAVTGELPDDGPQTLGQAYEAIGELENQLAGAETEIRGWRTRYANLARDKAKEAEKHALWGAAKALFSYWQVKCNHPGSKFTAERFWLCEPFLRDDGNAMCMHAVDGIAFDPFVTTRKNGTTCRHDSWELLFRSRQKFEEMASRAPFPEPTAQPQPRSTDAARFLSTGLPEPERADSLAARRFFEDA